MLNVILLSVIMLSVIMLSVIMLSVVAPYHATQNETEFYKTFFNEIYILANLQVLLDPLKPFYQYLTFQGGCPSGWKSTSTDTNVSHSRTSDAT